MKVVEIGRRVAYVSRNGSTEYFLFILLPPFYSIPNYT